mmetsp:Transcript_46082/g.73837  ORF Transcript_46082/g.73837 Transcript_46082/m.73837 type:complete len:258 (+) Transcript_46082:1207-1980(+)
MKKKSMSNRSVICLPTKLSGFSISLHIELSTFSMCAVNCAAGVTPNTVSSGDCSRIRNSSNVLDFGANKRIFASRIARNVSTFIPVARPMSAAHMLMIKISDSVNAIKLVCRSKLERFCLRSALSVPSRSKIMRSRALGHEPIHIPVVTCRLPFVWSITSNLVPNSLLRIVDLPLDCGPMILMMAYFCAFSLCSLEEPTSRGPPGVAFSLCCGALPGVALFAFFASSRPEPVRYFVHSSSVAQYCKRCCCSLSDPSI